MLGLKKYFNSSSLLPLVVFLISMITLLTAGQQLLHNHEVDLQEHDDCPAFHLFILFSSTILCYYFLILVLSFFTYLVFRNFLSFYFFLSPVYYSRAPPFQL